MSTRTYESWGKYPKSEPAGVEQIYWRCRPLALDRFERPVLPYGLGRSYGDCCLNDDGILIDVSGLDRFIAFDRHRGILRCEAGVTLEEVLELIVPHGWFLPVTPGTKHVTIGGAIANDVHGKNHHNAGTFGRHVSAFELERSNGERLICSPTRNTELFEATIGGLGLTGLILWAEFSLKRITTPMIDMERIRFGALDEFFDLSARSDQKYEYTVAWIDCLAQGHTLGRGVFMRGNHAEGSDALETDGNTMLSVPFDFPSFALNPMTMRAFNTVYYHSQLRRSVRRRVHYEPFFYPLDAVRDWNRIYGKRGFFQYQCVVPKDGDGAAIREIIARIARYGAASFLAVLKEFGDVPSPGMLSFPRSGVTLALDFPNNGVQTLSLFDELDELVLEAGGAVYPAKDARMSAESFQAFFPEWQAFSEYVDPNFSSSFWRRVSDMQTSETVS